MSGPNKNLNVDRKNFFIGVAIAIIIISFMSFFVFKNVREGNIEAKKGPRPVSETPSKDPAGPAYVAKNIKEIPNPILIRNPEEFSEKPFTKKGVVVVEYIIDTDGKVNAARIKSTNLNEEDSKAVLDSVRASIYQKGDKRIIISREFIVTPTVTRADFLNSKNNQAKQK